ncbi:MAG: hypothetical protein ACFB9N_11760 [Geitlerinemataceae cyanobacterium]
MDSCDLARYIEQTDGAAKPWLLVQLRLSKLKERRSEISHQEYIVTLADIQADLQKLGKWWVGRERDVFGAGQDSDASEDTGDLGNMPD